MNVQEAIERIKSSVIVTPDGIDFKESLESIFKELLSEPVVVSLIGGCFDSVNGLLEEQIFHVHDYDGADLLNDVNLHKDADGIVFRCTACTPEALCPHDINLALGCDECDKETLPR